MNLAADPRALDKSINSTLFRLILRIQSTSRFIPALRGIAVDMRNVMNLERRRYVCILHLGGALRSLQCNDYTTHTNHNARNAGNKRPNLTHPNFRHFDPKQSCPEQILQINLFKVKLPIKLKYQAF